MTSEENRVENEQSANLQQWIEQPASDHVEKTINRPDSEMDAKIHLKAKRLPLEKMMQVAELLK